MWRKLIFGLCLGLALPLSAQPLQTPPETAALARKPLTLDQSRALGLQAIRVGRPDIAHDVALVLLEKDKADPFAHFLMATALMHLKRLPEAELASKRAFRLAKSPEQYHQSARLAAQAAYQQGQFTEAQWWLRRAAHHAPKDAQRSRSIADFNAVKRQNPLSYSLRFSVTPSNNVNNGSEDAFNIIDGLPQVGVLSADAQALSGVTSRAGATLRYRLRESTRRSTFFQVNADFTVVTLDSAAKAQLDGNPEPELDTRQLEFSVQQNHLNEAADARLSYGISIGRRWQDGFDPRDHLRGNLGWTKAINPKTILSLATSAEVRTTQSSLTKNDQLYAVSAGLTRALPGGSSLGGLVFASTYRTELSGQSSNSIGLRVSFTPAAELGPMRMKFNLGLQKAEYKGYTLAGIVVPGGRRDVSHFAEVEVLFPKLDYLGFSPGLSLRHQQTNSNVSRFDTSETSTLLGIKSLF
ncbi:MAG: hypothetical protein ACJASV_003163 [Pseudorhodobacter sp.]|jgi:hypothetical protein